MIRKRDKRMLQIVAYVFSGLVVLSMVLSLLGPVLFREPATPTPTWPPTWTPTPLRTRTPTLMAPTVTLTNTAQVATPYPSPTWTPTPTLTTTSQSLQGPIGALLTWTELTADALTEPVADRLVFAVCGDSREGDAIHRKVLAQVAQGGSAFLVNVGDLVNHPPFDPDGTDHILGSGNAAFMALAQKHQVAYVFAGHIHAYSQAQRNGTAYVITGGGGAPLYTAGHPGAMYHYVQVRVEGTQVSMEVVPIT